MSNLIRWNPVREMAAMQTMMDRMFDDNFRAMFEENRLGANMLPLDVHEDDKRYTVSTELPGVLPENINIKVDGDVLVIDAEIPEQTTQNQGTRQLVKERRFGRYSRRMRLPGRINFDQAEASYEQGVLTLNLPKAAEQQPRTIQIRNGAANTLQGENK